jgi:hypothetical protein
MVRVQVAKISTNHLSQDWYTPWEPRETIRIKIGNIEKTLKVFPDTGASVCVMPLKMLRLFNITISDLDPPKIKTCSYDGDAKLPLGTINGILMFEKESMRVSICIKEGTHFSSIRSSLQVFQPPQLAAEYLTNQGSQSPKGWQRYADYYMAN